MKNNSNIQKKANEIIKLFIDNQIPFTQQLEIIKIVKQKIEFCRNTAKEVMQNKLNFNH